jgi:hypothetical protein
MKKQSVQSTIVLATLVWSTPLLLLHCSKTDFGGKGKKKDQDQTPKEMNVEQTENNLGEPAKESEDPKSSPDPSPTQVLDTGDGGTSTSPSPSPTPSPQLPIDLKVDGGCVHINHAYANGKSKADTLKHCEKSIKLSDLVKPEDLLKPDGTPRKVIVDCNFFGYSAPTGLVYDYKQLGLGTGLYPEAPRTKKSCDQKMSTYLGTQTLGHFNINETFSTPHKIVGGNLNDKWVSAEVKYNAANNHEIILINETNGWGECSTPSKSSHGCAACISDITIHIE